MTTNALDTKRLDGKVLSKQILDGIAAELGELHEQQAPVPKLVVVLVGNDPASEVYVNKKAKTADKIGMASDVLRFPEATTEAELLAEIQRLNNDPGVHGILVQLPLPKHLAEERVLTRIHPEKDADGLHPLNLGKLVQGLPVTAQPCTPAGIMALLDAYEIPLEGRHAVVVGRSNIVGKPVGMMLLARNATVTYCHSRTRHLSDITRQADVIVAAVGIPGMIKASDVKDGAVVIDVGINRLDGKLCGDVDTDAVAEKASFITPVPGGVGPMTIAMLMRNTLNLYRQQVM